MKISIVNTHDVSGGAGVAAHRLYCALKENNAEVSYFVRQKLKEESGAIKVFKNSISEKLSYYSFHLEKFLLFLKVKNKAQTFEYTDYRIGSNIQKFSEIIQSDVIHLHWFHQAFLNFEDIIKLAETKKIFWTLHDMWAFTGGCHYNKGCEKYKTHCGSCPILNSKDERDLSHKGFEMKKKLSNTNNIFYITPSHWMKEEAVKSPFISSNQVFVIPNPVDIKLYKPSEDKTNLKKELGLNLDKIQLLFVADKVLRTRKGFEYIEQALKILIDKHPQLKDKIELMLVGELNQKVNLPVSYISFGFCSEVATLIKYYQAADVFLLPSLEDNLPNTVMESLSCGTPVIGFDVGGVKDMVESGVNGFLTPFKNTQQFSEDIYKLILDENLLSTFSKGARETVLNKFSYEAISKKMTDLYQSKLS